MDLMEVILEDFFSPDVILQCPFLSFIVTCRVRIQRFHQGQVERREICPLPSLHCGVVISNQANLLSASAPHASLSASNPFKGPKTLQGRGIKG